MTERMCRVFILIHQPSQSLGVCNHSSASIADLERREHRVLRSPCRKHPHQLRARTRKGEKAWGP